MRGRGRTSFTFVFSKPPLHGQARARTHRDGSCASESACEQNVFSEEGWGGATQRALVLILRVAARSYRFRLISTFLKGGGIEGGSD